MMRYTIRRLLGVIPRRLWRSPGGDLFLATKIPLFVPPPINGISPIDVTAVSFTKYVVPFLRPVTENFRMSVPAC